VKKTMEQLLLLPLLVAVFWVAYGVRSAWTRRAAQAVGLTFVGGPLPEQRDRWRAWARLVHALEPTSWGHTLHGTFEGALLEVQEQELKTTVSSNRAWHCLVVWTLPAHPAGGLTAFRLERAAAAGRGLLRDGVAPLVDPVIQALGGEPDLPPPTVPDEVARDADFSRRFLLVGEEPSALAAHFDAARRQALYQWDPTGCIAGQGQTLVWLRPGRAGPTRIAALLDDARKLRLHCASA
jgi:hypothetical protein